MHTPYATTAHGYMFVLTLTFFMCLQFSAFQNDNSFNTILYQGSNVQTISINRTMDHVSVEGAFSIANMTNTGTNACGVSYHFTSRWSHVLASCQLTHAQVMLPVILSFHEGSASCHPPSNVLMYLQAVI